MIRPIDPIDDNDDENKDPIETEMEYIDLSSILFFDISALVSLLLLIIILMLFKITHAMTQSLAIICDPLNLFVLIEWIQMFFSNDVYSHTKDSSFLQNPLRDSPIVPSSSTVLFLFYEVVHFVFWVNDLLEYAPPLPLPLPFLSLFSSQASMASH